MAILRHRFLRHSQKKIVKGSTNIVKIVQNLSLAFSVITTSQRDDARYFSENASQTCQVICQEIFLMSPKGPHFTFCTMRPFKILIFRPILSFLNTYPPKFFSLISEFFKTGVFSVLCDFFFKFVFYQSPPSILTRNQRFCEHRGLLRVFGTVRLTGDIFGFFSQFFVFWEIFGWAKNITAQ